MAGGSSLAPGRHPPQLSGRGRLLAQFGVVLCGGVTAANIYITTCLSGVQCPPSTLKSSSGFSAVGLLIGVVGGALALSGLLITLMRKFNLIDYSVPRVVVPAGGRKHTICAIGFSLILFGSIAVSVNNFEHYSCLMPTGVVIRSGYMDTPRHLAWDDLVTVRARCWHSRPRNGVSYPGTTLDLGFNGVEVIPVSLGDGPGIDTRVFQTIRRALRSAHYYYELDASVTGAECPAELYPALLDFRSG